MIRLQPYFQHFECVKDMFHNQMNTFDLRVGFAQHAEVKYAQDKPVINDILRLFFKF